jgi:uncharacterized tellurite resistance protein B-like protein
MTTPGKNSTAACLWLLMLVLDADGKRRDIEFSEIQATALADDPKGQPEALMASLNQYYVEIDSGGIEGILDTVLHQIDDIDLRQKVYVTLMRVAISDRELHRREDTLLRRIGLAWGLQFNPSA